MSEEYKTVTKYIDNTNLNILFVAKHNHFIATYEKQYHVWSVSFENSNSRITEEAISPTNKLHEPSFIDLVYQFCVGATSLNLSQDELRDKFPNMSEQELNRIQIRGKRFESLKVSEDIVNKIASYNHNPKWKLWDASFLG